jgi:HlyD family secretion protein
VIVAVDNPDEKLRPSMTANITIDVATDRDVLRIPNAALRFKPSPSEAGASGAERRGTGGDAGGAARPGGGGGGTSGAGAPARPTLAGSLPRTGRKESGPSVYLLQPDGTLKPARIHPGITDGQFTEIRPDDLRVGDVVVTGLATTKAEAQSGPRMRF